jgi:hypothetical protein
MKPSEGLMTEIIHTKQVCAVCGTEIEFPALSSDNNFGTPDLDLRPSEIERSTLPYLIQTCSTCGYCSPDISVIEPRAVELVQAEIYKLRLKDRKFPELANAFLCWCLLQEVCGKTESAAWAAIHAAWACDDAGETGGAALCRIKAVDLLRAAIRGRKIRGSSSVLALMTDLLRRAGRFEEALDLCVKGLERRYQKPVHTLLRFQRELCFKKDMACYTVADAMKQNLRRTGTKLETHE